MNNPEMVQSAEKFAREKHRNQKKRDGVTPYADHLEGVVHRLKNLGVTDTDVVCAAWLHDVLEKTDAELEEIIQRFGKRAATLALAVSKDYSLPRREREDLYTRQLKDAPAEAKIIKLCDISANIKDLADSPLSNTQKNKQIRKILHYMRVIRKEVSGEKSRYPKIQDMADGINAVAAKFKQRPVLI